MKFVVCSSWFVVGALAVLGACSGDDAATAGGDGGSDVASGGDAGGNFAIEVACADAIDAVYADPGVLPAPSPDARGAIVECAHDRDVSKEALDAEARALGFAGRPFTSGARFYRVLYRTERGNDPATAGVSSALVMIPDVPRGPKPPVVVVSHGSRGQAAACAPSKSDPAGDYVKGDFVTQAYPLAGYGYPVIAPDLAGYVGAPPSLYAGAADVARSTLDGARALRKLVSTSVGPNVVVVGHSQGGHTALSALAFADAYGAGGPIAGVAVYAPLWLSQATWAALLAVAHNYPIASSPTPTAVSVWWHWTHGELLDGPGHGGDVFAADKRAAIDAFVKNDCWASHYPELEALGTYPDDLFDKTYVTDVKNAAALGGDCRTALCDKWKQRWTDDRPHLTGGAQTTPVLVLYGGKDDTIPPDRMQCVFDRLRADSAAFKTCFDPDADHGGIVRKRGDFAADWIASIAMGAPPPAACPFDEKALVDDAGTPLICATPPPN